MTYEETERFSGKPPFPWFGGKSRAAPLVWDLLGDVVHYVEPFAGGLAVLLNRPHPCNRPYISETVNDLDGLVVNAWRAITWHPEEVAFHASWPVTEADKHARQAAVIKWANDRMIDLLAGSPEWCDAKMAGWWLWGVAVQIGAMGGPWISDPVTGRLVKQKREPGVSRAIPHIGNDGRAVNHATLREPGVSRAIPHISDNGQGVNHQILREPGVSDDAPHYHEMTMPKLTEWMKLLSARLRHVRILNGDWSRVLTTGASKTLSVRSEHGPCGVFLDPPYTDVRSEGLYRTDSMTVAHDVAKWCVKNGNDKDYRIVLCGFDTEHLELEKYGWSVHEWFSNGYLTGGMGKQDHQMHRDRIWASPHCLSPDTVSPQKGLFDSEEP